MEHAYEITRGIQKISVKIFYILSTNGGFERTGHKNWAYFIVHKLISVKYIVNVFLFIVQVVLSVTLKLVLLTLYIKASIWQNWWSIGENFHYILFCVLGSYLTMSFCAWIMSYKSLLILWRGNYKIILSSFVVSFFLILQKYSISPCGLTLVVNKGTSVGHLTSLK